MKSIIFQFKMTILDFVQNLLLRFSVFIRPARQSDLDFVFEFLQPKNIGLELFLIGDGSDGSYVLPNDLDGISHCFSPGVGPTSQFETEIFDRFGIRSFLIDASVDRVPSSRDDFYEFEKKFLGAVTYDNVISLDDWVMDKVSPSDFSDLMLQIDIEGHEYSSLLSADSSTLNRFRLIAMEIHFLDLLNIEVFSTLFTQFLRKLDRSFVVCYMRKNDCCGVVRVGERVLPRVLELTLIRRDRIVSLSNAPIEQFLIKNT